ncbi:MAG: M6 family metalloprotease domain-containing protein [Candidatus Eisenbacteria bacterium]
MKSGSRFACVVLPVAFLLLGSGGALGAPGSGLLLPPEENPRFVVYDLPPAEIEARLAVPYEEMERRRGEVEVRVPSDTGVVLVLLCQWEDDPADTIAHPPEAYDTLLFSEGFVDPGSMREYFLEVSYGSYWIEGDIVGWLTRPTYISSLWFTDFLEAADPFVDFSDYDRDGDGYTDAVWIFHAGPGEEETHDPDHIWSYAVYGLDYMTDDGVIVDRYSCNPEEHADGSIITIRVGAHEASHVLGLPDLYDYDSKLDTVTYYTPNDANDHPMVDWCLMGYGGYNIMAYVTRPDPSHLCAWSKKQLGWVTPIVLSQPAHRIPLPETNTNPFACRISRPGTTKEYFLIENRNANSSSKFDHLDGDFSAYFHWFTQGANEKDSGILIYHVDDNMSRNNGWPTYAHYKVRVEDAGYDPSNPWDGSSEFSEWWYPYEFRIGAAFAGEDPGQNAFTPNTTPSTDWYTGPSGIWITNIGESDSVMTFDIGFGNAWPAIVDHRPVSLDTTLEQGMSHPFSAAAVDLDGDPTTYVWSVNGGIVASGADSTFLYVPGAAGTTDTITIAAHDGELGDTLSWRVFVDVSTGAASGAPRALPSLAAAPTPFNATLAVRAEVPAGEARLAVYDLTGRLVDVLAEGPHAGGAILATWNGRSANGRDVPSGVYFLRLETVEGTLTEKVVLLR